MRVSARAAYRRRPGGTGLADNTPAMGELTQNRRRPVHRHRGYKWHPRGTLYERLSAFAEAHGLLRSEALSQLVEDGLAARQRDDAPSGEDPSELSGRLEA